MFLFDTKCGKTMKNHLYKYHQKKCDICKGEKILGVNIDQISRECKQNRGKTFDEVSLKEWKSTANKIYPNKKNEILDQIKDIKSV